MAVIEMAQECKLDRISSSDIQTFESEYRRPRKPVILLDLFKGQEIGAMTDFDAARTKLRDVPVLHQQNYISSYVEMMGRLFTGVAGGEMFSRRRGTVGEYLDLVEKDPATSWLVTESDMPEVLAKQVDLRALGITQVNAGQKSERGQHIANSLMFLANPGNASDLHSDWDGRDVILFQGFGRKRVTLFPPDSAPLLLPIQQYATVRLNGIPESDRQELVRYGRGWDDVLQPGEAVYMPAFYWHHLEYIDLALSFGFRFGGIVDPDANYLLQYGHRDMYVQNVMAATLEDGKSEVRLREVRKIRAMMTRDYSGARAKYRAIRKEFQRLYDEFCPDAPGRYHSWIDYSTFLDGLLCAPYVPPPPHLTGLRRKVWKHREALRLRVREIGFYAAGKI